MSGWGRDHRPLPEHWSLRPQQNDCAGWQKHNTSKESLQGPRIRPEPQQRLFPVTWLRLHPGVHASRRQSRWQGQKLEIIA